MPALTRARRAGWSIGASGPRATERGDRAIRRHEQASGRGRRTREVGHLVHRPALDLVAVGRIEPQERRGREIDRPQETARDERPARVQGGPPPDLPEPPALTG